MTKRVFEEGQDVQGRGFSQETQTVVNSWEESCLKNFSVFLGFPMDGFEEEI